MRFPLSSPHDKTSCSKSLEHDQCWSISSRLSSGELKSQFIFGGTHIISFSKQDGQNKGSHPLKKNSDFMKNFHKMVTPPPSCICEILIQIFNRKFRDKIKMRQNSVNNHQSHTKFRCSTRLMQWTSYLSFLTHQSILFWPKICHFEPLNFWIRVWKRADPPPPFVNKIHKTVLFFKGWLPLPYSW